MPDSASPSTTKTPTPRQPAPDVPVEDAAPTLEWTAVPNATTYHLQVAPRDTFDTLLFDSNVGNLTSITLYDVVPQDGGTYFWRVRAETSSDEAPWWSEPASFTMKKGIIAVSASRRSRTSASDGPLLREPTEGAPVDGQSALFHWDPVSGAQGYEVEIAASPDFDDPFTVEPGETTKLTLYGMLPVDGSAFFWRVRALRSNHEWTDWSEAARFVAATDEEFVSYQEEQERKAEEAKEAAAAVAKRDEEHVSPVLTARTSPYVSLGISSLMLVSFLLTILLVAQAGV